MMPPRHSVQWNDNALIAMHDTTYDFSQIPDQPWWWSTQWVDLREINVNTLQGLNLYLDESAINVIA